MHGSWINASIRLGPAHEFQNGICMADILDVCKSVETRESETIMSRHTSPGIRAIGESIHD